MVSFQRSTLPAWCVAILAAGGCASTAPRSVKVEGASNLKQAGSVYIAGAVTPEAAQTLGRRGVTTVFDFRQPEQVPEGYADTVREMGLRYVGVPMKSTALTAEQADAFLTAVREHPDESLLLQCASGNRSGAMYGVYLMDRHAVEPAAALKAAREAGMRNEQLAADLERYLKSRAREP